MIARFAATQSERMIQEKRERDAIKRHYRESVCVSVGQKVRMRNAVTHTINGMADEDEEQVVERENN
jgi:hypothetical protein